MRLAGASWGRAGALGALLCLGLASACTESGQILSELAEGEAAGGSPSVGTGGMSMVGIGGEPLGDLVPGPTGARLLVDSGDVHTCAIVDGALYCWGDNNNGALGLGDFESRDTPTLVGLETDWEAVGSGDGFSCGIRAGNVFCWGRGASGQLGAGQFTASAVPLAVDLPSTAVSVAVGHQHACAIVEGGALYCWGQNSEGQLAQDEPFTGPGVNSDVPLPVGAGETWASVTAGQGHTCAIASDGSLWCWGRNTRGELGLGPDAAGQIRVPALVGSDTDWAQVAAGQNHTCGIRGEQLYCWGDNSHAQLGEPITEFATEPTLVTGMASAQAVSLDTFHTCAIDTGNQLFCWGRNIEGQLGDGTIEAKDAPTRSLPTGSWELVSAGRFHTCGVRQETILCTGDNSPGRLGTGDDERRREFTPTAYHQ